MNTQTKRAAIVTGAGRGIGLAIARRLGQDGCALVLTGRSPAERYADALQSLTAAGITFRYVQADVSEEEGRRKTLAAACEAFGRVDILVNNAGVAPLQRADLLEMTPESFDRVLRINTRGNMFLTQLAARQMLTQQPDADGVRGVIVNISSCSAEVSSVNRGEYCVSKAGVAMLTQLYADRLAGEGYGILMISSELSEVVGISDRVYVMKDGEITGEVTRPNLTQEAIMRYAVGGEEVTA